MTLVVTSKVSATEVRAAVEKLFPAPPKAEEAVPEVRAEAVLGRILRADALAPEQQPRRDLHTAYFAFRLPPADVEMIPLMDALTYCVGNGRSGRMGRRLVETEKVALNVTSEYLPGVKDSLFLVSVTATPANSARLETAFEAEIRRMREDYITDDEADSARAYALGRLRYAGETVEGRARQLAGWDQYAPGLTDDVYRVKMIALKAADLQVAIRRFLTPLSFTVASVGPGGVRPGNQVTEGGQP